MVKINRVWKFFLLQAHRSLKTTVIYLVKCIVWLYHLLFEIKYVTEVNHIIRRYKAFILVHWNICTKILQDVHSSSNQSFERNNLISFIILFSLSFMCLLPLCFFYLVSLCLPIDFAAIFECLLDVLNSTSTSTRTHKTLELWYMSFAYSLFSLSIHNKFVRIEISQLLQQVVATTIPSHSIYVYLFGHFSSNFYNWISSGIFCCVHSVFF